MADDFNLNGQLTSEKILQSNLQEPVRVDVPEWGGHCYVRVMTGDERDAFEMSMVEKREDGSKRARHSNIRATVAALTVCDKDGKRLFSLDHVKALGKKSGSALSRIFNVAAKLNHLGADDVEELAGN